MVAAIVEISIECKKIKWEEHGEECDMWKTQLHKVRYSTNFGAKLREDDH